MPTTAQWRAAGRTDIGRQRQSNQDQFLLLDPLRCWIVADGMGGHAGGGVASRLAVDVIAAGITHLDDSRPPDQPDHRTQREETLRTAIAHAHRAVRDAARQNTSLTGMGTTVVVLRLYLTPVPEAVIAHVGDSRAYLFRKGGLQQLTVDHSMIEEYQRQGFLTPEEAQHHPLRHVLSRAVGPDREVLPDCSTFELAAGDRILLCTDGLTKMLSDRDIMTLLIPCSALDQTCEQLVAEANRQGGDDNVTVVLVEYTA